ncbi:MAG: L-histidine N(alpha)-methyltransferase [Bacteroidia bacterium]|nr:L-histidine N(alpha)-methyltransferase [Bacteroidia bacterium]
MDTISKTETAFSKDVREGLIDNPKHISSKYFYDERGSELFRQIMRMPSYYPTDLEFEIFQNQKARILKHFAEGSEAFQMIEFGAGDGLKTKILLSHFLKEKVQFSYSPIDISGSAVENLTEDLEKEFPNLILNPFIGDYFKALHEFSQKSKKRKAVLFLGSNIGNFTETQAIHFLSSLGAELNSGDKLLIGFDLKKDPNVILAAYNDPEGITREFNLNLLRRMNRELGANFDLDKFMHAPSYDPMTGETKSFIVSKEAQRVYFENLKLEVDFYPWEAIWTELSQKYDFGMIESLARESGFEVETHLNDEKAWYVDSIWRKK